MPETQQGSRQVPAAAVLCRGLTAFFGQLSSSKPAPHEVPDAVAERAAAAGALCNLLARSQAAKVSCCKPCDQTVVQHRPGDMECQAGGLNHSRPRLKLPVCLQAAALAMELHTTLLECVADSHALLMMHSFKAAQQSGPAAVAITASGTTPRSPAAAGSRASTSRSKLPFPRIPGSGAAVHASSVRHPAHTIPSAEAASLSAGYPSLAGRKPTSQSGASGGRSAPADAVTGQPSASQEQGVVDVQPAPVQAAALDTAGELARQQLLHALSILKHMALGCPAAGRALAQGDVMDVLRRCVMPAGA